MTPTVQRYVKKTLCGLRANWVLYLMLLPSLCYIVVFNYIPMSGIAIAFKDYKVRLGIWGSEWVGFKYFERFFNNPSSGRIIWNTVSLNLYVLFASFPLPVLVALLLNQCGSKRFSRVVQNVLYAPHFISTIIVVGMMQIMLSPSSGVVNSVIKAMGGEPYFFFGEPDAFQHMYVWSGIWQNLGFSSIVYIAALAGVSPELHEAAIVDGATKIRRIISIDLPTILPTVIIMMILAIGRIMSLGFDKVYLMQNSVNLQKSEVISTYIYKRGLLDTNYSLATAVGLFNNVINLALLFTVNKAADKLTGSSLF